MKLSRTLTVTALGVAILAGTATACYPTPGMGPGGAGSVKCAPGYVHPSTGALCVKLPPKK